MPDIAVQASYLVIVGVVICILLGVLVLCLLFFVNSIQSSMATIDLTLNRSNEIYLRQLNSNLASEEHRRGMDSKILGFWKETIELQRSHAGNSLQEKFNQALWESFKEKNFEKFSELLTADIALKKLQAEAALEEAKNRSIPYEVVAKINTAETSNKSKKTKNKKSRK